MTLAFGIINPLFEAPDEHHHFFTSQIIADSRQLPMVEPGRETLAGQEAAQPPLYYLMSAMIIAPLGNHANLASAQLWENSHVRLGDTSALNNINRFIHLPLEAWPWQGYVLAAHLLRMLSTLMGLGTLVFVYLSARLLWPASIRRALLAVALVAFLPQYGFIHGAISNDSLITLLSSAVIWQLLRLWLTQVSTRRLLILGITIGLAALSKNAGLLLLIYAAIFLVLMAIRDNNRTLVLKTLLLVLLPTLAIAGWLWWRNWILYGDVTAANQFISIAGGSRDYTLWQVLAETSGLWLSAIAIFGWFNVRAPDWVYLVWNTGIALAFAGVLRRIYHDGRSGELQAYRTQPSFRLLLNRPWFVFVLLLLWFLMVYAGLVRFMLQTEAAQGRLLMPAIVPIALILAYGLSQIGWPLMYRLAPPAALLTTVYCIFLVIRPAYMKPVQIAELPADIPLVNQEMGQGLRLLGAKAETSIAEPGDVAWFTLYWQADAPPEEPPELVVELFGREVKRLGHVHSYHGRGLYPANLWPEGRILEDRFAVRLEDNLDAPVLAWAQARLVGDYPAANIGSVKIVPVTWPNAPETIMAQLGAGINLSDAALSHTRLKPGETLQLSVTWQVSSAPMTDLTTIVHLGAAGVPPVATGDSLPLDGSYPTYVWAEGEVIKDNYRLSLPADLAAGRYPVWIGMYDPAKPEQRLPLMQNGARQPNDLFLAGWVEVAP